MQTMLSCEKTKKIIFANETAVCERLCARMINEWLFCKWEASGKQVGRRCSDTCLDKYFTTTKEETFVDERKREIKAWPSFLSGESISIGRS
jgi:hypothetical protein